MAAQIHGNNVLFLLSKPTPDLLTKPQHKAIFVDPSAATYSAPAKYGGTPPLKPPKRLRKEDNQITRCKRRLDFARLGLPVQKHNPVVAAKRNERERNRVKHINDTFTVLRDHLPEDYNTAQKANKEMSKVEILRAAIDYIQTLEQMLTGKLQISSDIDLKALIQASTSPDSKTSELHKERIANFIKQESQKRDDGPTSSIAQTVTSQTLSQPHTAPSIVNPSQLQFTRDTNVKISSDLNDNEVKCYPDFMHQPAALDLVQYNQVSQSHQFDTIHLEGLLPNNNITNQTLKSAESLVSGQSQITWQPNESIIGKGLNTGAAFGQVPTIASPAPSSTDSACDQASLFDSIDLTDVDFTSLLMSM